MYIFKKHVSRRTVLKGIGVGIALPLLDSMNPAATAWAQTPAGKTPQRFAFVGFPHGAVMDPLGFALENFDATGRWRDRDRYAGVAIDSAGELPDGTSLKGPDDLRNALLRRPEQFVQTFTEALLVYATGRTLQPYDMPAVRRMVRGAAAGDYKFSALVQSVVRSEQFKMRRVPQPATVAQSNK